MSQFLYFVPGLSGQVTPAQVDAVGLSHMHEGLQPDCRDSGGPDGLHGVLLTAQRSLLPKEEQDPKARVKLLYDAKGQTWIPLRANGSADDAAPIAYVGMQTDRPPTPASLLRRRVYDGAVLVFENGLAWTVPVAHAFAKEVTLPRRMRLGPDGRMGLRVEDRFAGLCERAAGAFQTMRQSMLEDGAATWKYGDLWELSLIALGVNYRVGAGEISLLGGLSGDEMLGVARAVCDWDEYEKALIEFSKNEPASASADTGSGAEANSPATDPLSATSA